MHHKPIPYSRQERRQFSAGLVQLLPELWATIKEIADYENRHVGIVVNELMAFAIAHHKTAEVSLAVWQQLTQREREVTARIWLGQSNPQIAETLRISENTVKTHIKSLLAKFNVHSKSELRLMLIGVDFSEWIEATSPDGVTL